MNKLISGLLFSLIGVLCVSPVYVSADSYNLYAAYALTGVGSSFGSVELNGTTLAIEEFNAKNSIEGKKVKLVVEDTQSSNTATLSAVRKLRSFYKADIILGPTWLDSFQSVLPLAEREKFMLFTPSAAVNVFKDNTLRYPLVFSTWFNLEIEIKNLLDHLKRQGLKRIMLIFDQDPFFQTIREITKRNAADLGLDIVRDDSVPLEGADFRASLTKARSNTVDGAMFGFGNESNLLAFLKQRGELASKLKLYGTDYLEGYVAQEKWLPLFEDVEYISPAVHSIEFVERYKKRFGEAPVLSASTAYDATTILLKALQSGVVDPEGVHTYLLKGSFDTATFGPVRFNTLGGVGSSEFVIKMVKGGEIRELSVRE